MGNTPGSDYLRAMKCDYLIVGQGIAGSTLALELISNGATVQVMDVTDPSSSSRVAAGLFNPIVFRRITFSWRAKESLREARRFYASQEELTGLPIFFPINLHRIHGSEGEMQDWNARKSEPEFDAFLEATPSNEEKPWLNQPFGGARVYGAGFVDTRSWLNGVRRILSEKGLLFETHFDPEVLEVTESGIRYEEIEASKIIFCEGSAATENPWFKALPFNPAKGEVLLIHAPGLPHEIFNSSIYGVPLGDGIFRVGSTYEWDALDALPTEEKRLELEEKLRNILRVPFTVIGHEAGIRPTVRDRRPLLGFHPQHPSIGIFNGLGTKGVLLAPLLAKEMTRHMLHGEALSPEVNIVRFIKRLKRA